MTQTLDAYREGTARVTLFAANGVAQTFDYQPGDISYIPTAYGELFALYPIIWE